MKYSMHKNLWERREVDTCLLPMKFKHGIGQLIVDSGKNLSIGGADPGVCVQICFEVTNTRLVDLLSQDIIQKHGIEDYDFQCCGW